MIDPGPAPIHDDYERRLVCSRCGQTVIVAELPERYLDALGYLCGQCLEAGSDRVESSSAARG